MMVRLASVGVLLLAILGSFALPGKEPMLLILQKAGSSLGFYTVDGRHLTSVPVGQHPHEFAVSKDGRYAYTTDNGTMRLEEAGAGGNTISIVDLEARKKAGEISLGEFRRPHGIDLDAEGGRLAVSCELPDRLLIVDTASRKIIRHYDTKGKTSHMVRFSRDGKKAFVSNAGSNAIAAVDLASGEVRLIPTSRRPEGSILSKNGKRLYVATREDISIIDVESLTEIAKIRTGKGPVRVSLTPDETRLVYALIDENAVGIADIASRKEIAKIALAGRPVSISVSGDGRLAYASAQDDDTVYVISIAEKKISRTIRTPEKAGPDPVLHIGDGPR